MRSGRLVLAVAASAAITMAADTGEASIVSTTCTVTKVGWATGGSGTLQTVCGGNWYFAFGSSGSCPTASIDTRKAWQSLMQAALLSGKPLYLEYENACSGGPGLTYVRLGG